MNMNFSQTVQLIYRMVRYNLKVIEDAAQALLSSYKGKPCGAMSDFGCFSFHETKNFTMGEGGAIVIRGRAEAEERRCGAIRLRV